MKGLTNFFSWVTEEKDFIKNSTIVFMSTSFSNLILLLINLYFSRFFGPVLFGNYKTVIYLFSLLPSLIDFGMSLTLTKYIAEFRMKDKKKIGHMIRWFLKIRVVSFLVLLGFLFFFKDQLTVYFLHDGSLSYMMIAGLFILGAGLSGVLPQMVIGYENFKLSSFSNVLSNVLYAIIGISLGYYFGVFYAIIGYAVSVLIGNIVCLNFLLKQDAFKKDEEFDVRGIFWKYSLPMYLLNIPSYLGLGIVPVLSLFFTNKIIGYFSFAFMFYYAGLMIPTSLSIVFFPKVSRLHGLNRHDEALKSLKRILGTYTVIVALGIIVTVLLSEWFVSIVAKDYLPGLLLFKVIISLGLLLGYFQVYGSYLSAKDQIRKTALIVLLQNFILFAVSFVLLSMT
jgi:O-antigen/teichoic acid export membrane protein